MRDIFVLLAIFVFLFTPTAFAETSIKAEVDKTSLTTDEILTYKIIITSDEKKLPAPEVPKFEGFNILSSAQSSTMSLVKSNIKTILVYVFILAPIDIGKFKIEPSTIKIKDKIYSSASFEIELTPGKTKTRPLPEQKPSQPEETQAPSKEPQFTL